VEPRLDVLDVELRNQIESDFLRYRELLRSDEARATAAAERDRLLGHVNEAETTLAAAEFGPAAAFVASLTVLAREGFEAVLIVLALSGLLVRSGRRDALRYVHAGWTSALVAGIATWIAARRLIEISGADRELIEGASSLIAAGILFYVSYWLIAKVSSRRWQGFLQTRIHGALRGGSLWTLAAIAFIAVYREVFETILFFEAIVTQAGPTGLRAVVFGALAGGLLLATLALGAFRFGLRMPVRRFFVLSSALLYALAVVLGGQGVAALQEAGKLPVTRVPFVRIDWLGIHPTLESLGVQALLIAAAVLAGCWVLAHRENEPVVEPGKASA
jgi:high-affinity iron transporter